MLRSEVALIAGLLVVSRSPCCATTLRVPADYPYICGALEVAQYGDTVLVAPGTYSWHNDSCPAIPDGVVLTSEVGPATTTIEAYDEVLHDGLIEFAYPGGHEESELSGFTIVRRLSSDTPAVIACTGGAPLIRNNVIVPPTDSGVELYIAIRSWLNGSPRISSNTIVGAGLPIEFSGALSAPVISHNILAIVPGRELIAIGCAAGSSPVIRCNDIWGYYRPYSSSCAPAESDFYEDPLFCDPNHGDYSLREDSPAVHGYGCGLVGALPVGCGTTVTATPSWGAMKQTFR